MRTINKATVVVGGVLLAVAGLQVAQAVTEPSVPTYTGCLAIDGSNKGKLFAVATGFTPTRDCASTEKQVRLSSGDITSVAGGQAVKITSTELGLPDTNGSVSLDLAPSYKLPQSCLEGQLLRKAAGVAWACQAPDKPLGGAQLGYVGTARRQIGDDWSVLGDGLDLPAGSYAITAKAMIDRDSGGDLYRAFCRLDATGSPGLDHSDVFIDEYDNGSLPVVLVAAVTKTSPFRVSVVCKDYGDGITWHDLRLLATPVAATTSTNLGD
jgi:hypothetical protein